MLLNPTRSFLPRTGLRVYRHLQRSGSQFTKASRAARWRGLVAAAGHPGRGGAARRSVGKDLDRDVGDLMVTRTAEGPRGRRHTKLGNAISLEPIANVKYMDAPEKKHKTHRRDPPQ